MSRFAEASARAGRAVPDNSPVDWATEREAAKSLLSGTAPQQAARRSPPTTVSSPPPEPGEPTFSWPPNFDLDEIDLSRDSHARGFRRPSARMQASHEELRVKFDAQRPRHHSELRQESVASSHAPGVSATLAPPRETAASSRRGTGREPSRAEAPRVTLRWVIIAVALIVLLASAALLTYLLRNRQVGATQQNVRTLVISALLIPISLPRRTPRG